MAKAIATPQDVTAKWLERLSGSTTAIENGVRRVQTAPGVAAAAKYDKWQAGLQANAQKWRRNVAAVPLQTWQDRMINIGAPRVATGAQAKQDKFQSFMSQFLPFVDNAAQRVRAMPDTTYEQRKARANAMMDALHAFQRGGSGS